MPLPHTVFVGAIVSTQTYLHKQHFSFMWHPRLRQKIELEYEKNDVSIWNGGSCNYGRTFFR